MVLRPSELALLLTAGCNLGCSYCYLRRDRPGTTMGWETLTAAVKEVLESGPEELLVEFTGGEPLLEVDLIKRAVEFIDSHRPAGTTVDFSLTTNGILLGPDLLSYLNAHGFSLRLSFDGVSAAQDLRGPRTFAVLDRLLVRLRRELPDLLAERVTVAITLVAPAIPHLAESVRYLVGMDVGRIGISPRLTCDSEWTAASRDDLERQVDDILELSADHWRTTGRVPVGFLAGAPLRDRDAPVGDVLCRGFTGSVVCVAPDGRLCTCPLFAGSLTPLPPLARGVARTADLGRVSDGRLPRRLASLRRRATASRVLGSRPAKHSSYGACASCRFFADCSICPASICHIPGNRDPHLVPDSVCAFNRVTLAARERFDDMTGGEQSGAWYREVESALAGLEAALKEAGGTTGGRRAQSSAGDGRHPIRDVSST